MCNREVLNVSKFKDLRQRRLHSVVKLIEKEKNFMFE